MIQNELLREIHSLYYFTKEVRFSHKVDRGYLSQNYVLENNEEKFFLKQYRFTERKSVEEVHRVKFFFAEKTIPVILPIQTIRGESFFDYQGVFYALFPFREGQQYERGEVPDKALENSARLLAHLHQQSRTGQLDLVAERSFAWKAEKFFPKVEKILAKIAHLKTKTDFDIQAEKLLLKKLGGIQKGTLSWEDFAFKADHIIHGDFHEANIFFTENDDVLWLFDWEKTNLAPRVIEVARALEFLCFSGNYEEENFRKAKVFLRAYNEVYPLESNELSRGVRAWYLNQLYSTWIFEEHYLKDNTRPDTFLDYQIKFHEYYSEHLEEHIKKLQQ